MKPSVRSLYSAKEPFAQRPEFSRTLIVFTGLVYLVWWGVVHLFLPQAFNPLGSRLAVVFLALALFTATFFSPALARRSTILLSVLLWALTAHYFYLFVRNEADPAWVVGCYITLAAVCACLQLERHLLAYAGWVLTLSLAVVFKNHRLLGTIFLPGILTVLLLAYLGLRARMRSLNRSMETSQWFQDLFDSVFDGICVHDRGLILHANNSFAKMFGYEPGEVVGMHVSDFVMPTERDHAMGQIEVMSELPYQVCGSKKDGSTVPIEIRGKKHVVNGKVLRLAALVDITDRIKLEEERVRFESSQRSIQMRDEFLSVASHELKTPLTTIMLHTQMAARGLKRGDASVLDPAKTIAFVEQMDRQANRLRRLVDEMLDVARISSNGKLTLDRESFDLVALINEVIGSFQAQLTQAGTAFSTELPARCLIEGDRFRLEQVVSNLLSNSIKYGAGSPIRVVLEWSAAEARLAVYDQGIGIAPENHERIFQRFERAISGRNISGLGLGLFISKDIVEGHGGRIEVSSALNEGSCFTVYLPLKSP